jgi:hypothetical protein
MLRKRWLSLGALALLGGAVQAQDRVLTPSPTPLFGAPPVIFTQAPGQAEPPMAPEGGIAPGTPEGGGAPQTREQGIAAGEGEPSPEGAYGPTPLADVKILQNLLFGEQEKPWLRIAGWADFDYTYRSTGSGQNNVAPVMNRFGDEFLARQFGLYLWKPLDPTCWSWGFNSIFIAGSDASFIQPTAGYPAQTNPRFGQSFTDLNLTAHLPILTDGGVDVKAGRQTTVLGPMGALPWQRYFDSSDYAWYILEEGRYTGVSATWHISKQLDWYNGIEIGGWGVFYDNPSRNVNYLGQVNYWLDEEAKKTKVWFTVLTGPTGFFDHGGNTTTAEVGIQHNWSQRVYQIIDTQMTYSKAPLFVLPPPGYQQRSYDVYTYLGYHLNKCWDVNSRFEWFKDVDGNKYPGGLGVPNTDYFEVTLGPDYHPTKWLQFRPEIRYDYATKDNFGAFNDKKNQLSIAVETLFKF